MLPDDFQNRPEYCRPIGDISKDPKKVIKLAIQQIKCLFQLDKRLRGRKKSQRRCHSETKFRKPAK